MFRLCSRYLLPVSRFGRQYTTANEVQERIGQLVKDNKVVLFMKGTPDQPMCGFSRAVVQIMDIHEVARSNLSAHNVLEDEDIRQGKGQYLVKYRFPKLQLNVSLYSVHATAALYLKICSILLLFFLFCNSCLKLLFLVKTILRCEFELIKEAIITIVIGVLLSKVG